MGNENINLWQRLARADVESLVQFFDPEKNRALNDMQTTGCHALWNTLCDEDLRFAYLADEVGMGKTYQALGVIGILHYLKPGARVVILCPGREMQKQWGSDWHTFFQEKYCPGGIDGNLKGYRQESSGAGGFESCFQPQVCHSLFEFAARLMADQSSVYLLRYTSFSLPVRVFEWEEFAGNSAAQVSTGKLVRRFQEKMEAIGIFGHEKEICQTEQNQPSFLNLDEATKQFQSLFVDILSRLVRGFRPDLIVWDEAQYLRTNANRNDSLSEIFGEKLFRQGCRHLFLSATPAHRDVQDLEQLNRLFPQPLIQIPQDAEVRKDVAQWMVRREREFNGLGKRQYRDYRLQPVDLFREGQSPLYALTFAAMQKKLVELLDGRNNRFRMGEISSHESAMASITRYVSGKADGHGVLEECSPASSAEPIDESYLEQLGDSFRVLQNREDGRALGLPHAKVDQVVRELAGACLAKGSRCKELVFVRRLDTVDELADRLLHEFQSILDGRIRLLGADPHRYWELPPDSTDDDDLADGEGPEENGGGFQSATENLPYFKALSAVKGSLGRLTVYRNTLGRENSTLRFLWVPRDQREKEDRELWASLLRALKVSDDFDRRFQDPDKELLLRRCIGHSLRFTDILVDLDVLRQHHRSDYVGQWIARLANPEGPLAGYFLNVRDKLYDWVKHFDLIVNKCFKESGTRNSYADIAQRVAKYFTGLSPVARRSGRRKEANVVPQFKFPIHPNILVCTDVLREGVNLHLFCERVSHYGIAWNSGDLEQRIGRVERADSLFEKQILADPSHRLPVLFPYLAGTLDERQVIRATNQKQRLDQLFSLLPPRETGECPDAKELPVRLPDCRQKAEPILPPVQDGPPIGRDWRGKNEAEMEIWQKALQSAHAVATSFPAQEGFRYAACRMMGEFRLIAIQWEKLSRENPSWTVCDKMVFDTFERRRQWKTSRILYLPVSQTVTPELLRSFWDGAARPVCGTSRQETLEGFAFCGARQTHVHSCDIPHPFGQEQPRTQDVCFYRWGKNGALVSPVGGISDLQRGARTVEQVLSDINQDLPLGSATILNQQVVLCLPVLNPAAWPAEILLRVGRRLAHWADRHQWLLLGGKDDDDMGPAAAPISGVCEMNTREAIEILCGVRKWCQEINDALKDALGEESFEWAVSSFDEIVHSGDLVSVSPERRRSGLGKYQIGYVLSGLNESPAAKRLTFHLAGKRANIRVSKGGMEDIRKILKEGYAEWLAKHEYTILCDDPDFQYGFWDCGDDRPVRRLRISLPADQMEIQGKRAPWIGLIAELTEKLFQNDVFRYNESRSRVENLRSQTDRV